MRTEVIAYGLLLCVSLTSFAQPPDTLWTRNLGYYEDYIGKAVDIDLTVDGNYLLITEPDHDFYGFTALFMSPEGEVVNEHQLPDIDFTPTSAIALEDGGYICAGMTHSYDLWGSGSMVMRVSAAGDTVWTRVYNFFQNFGWNGHTNSVFWDAVRTGNDEFILCGAIDSAVTEASWEHKAVLTAIDGNGEILWSTRVAADGNPEFKTLTKLTDGRIAAAGTIRSYGSSDMNYLMVSSFEANGSFVWTRSFSCSEMYYIGVDIAPAQNGEMLLSVQADSLWGIADVDLMRVGANGDPVWMKSFGNGSCIALIPAITGGYTCLWDDLGLMRINERGDSLWTTSYDLSDSVSWFAQQTCFLQTSDSSYVIAGETYIGIPEGYQLPVIRTTSDCEIIGVERDAQIEMPNNLLLSSYPNPFNPTATIEFELPLTADVRLLVFNIQGQQVAELMNQRVNAGRHTVNFDGTNYPSGLYFARLQAGNCTKTHKLMLIK